MASLPPLTEADSLSAVQENLANRAERDEFFRSNPDSPFRVDSTTSYEGINWYPVNPRFRGHSILHRYAQPETVTVMGTKGETRRQLRCGYLEFVVPGEHELPVTVRMNVYKFTPYDTLRYSLYKDLLNVWFTDETTGKETYDVGRYVEVGEEISDPSHLYTIDLNMAYNPFCAYSDVYSCTIPRKDDHIRIPLRVGEKKYHDRSQTTENH